MKALTEMNKAELRAECKEHGVKNYSKMNNEGMRQAILAALNPSAEVQLPEVKQRKAGSDGLDTDWLNLQPTEQAEVDFDEPQRKEVTYNEAGDPVVAGEVVIAVETPAPAGTGVKIEKVRPEQNGVKRPSAGGVCREVWDWCDEFRAEHGRSPLPKEAKPVAESKGWNANNATCEIYQWRKFNGIRGRVVATETK